MERYNLWGDELFDYIDDTSSKKIIYATLDKIKDVERINKKLNSASTTLDEKVYIVEQRCLDTLSIFVDKTRIITDYDELNYYIDKAIKFGTLAIDTETNNTTDVFNCKIMGLCLYFPNDEDDRQVYVPINHTNLLGTRLKNQINEEQLKIIFDKLKNSKCLLLYHNSVFDIEVIYYTCGVLLPYKWDTQIVAFLRDENGSHKLKDIYTSEIDKRLSAYSIEKIFGNVPYQYINPSIFGIYAAADPYETYMVYLKQVEYLNKLENIGVKKVWEDVECPLLEVVLSIEMLGVNFDKEYAKRLEQKYIPIKEKLDVESLKLLDKFKDTIEEWKKTPEAQKKFYNPETKTYSKSKAATLDNPIKLSSPTQISILLYDILKYGSDNRDDPDFYQDRKTDEDALTNMYERTKEPLIDIILDLRGVNKLLNTYIGKLPKLLDKNGRLHGSFNPIGAKTGRFSSSNPNLQNIPSKNHEVRLLFTASVEEHLLDIVDNYYCVAFGDEVQLKDGSWVNVDDLRLGMVLENDTTIKNITKDSKNYIIYVGDAYET